MSKELLLEYAKGGEMKPKYNVRYEVDPIAGKIIIHDCVKTNQVPNVWAKIVHTETERNFEVTDEAIQNAIDDFLKTKNIKMKKY